MADADRPVVLDTDLLSEISRGTAAASGPARRYLERHGRFTVTAITVDERLRGYRAAIRQGKPFAEQLDAFEMAARSLLILPFDATAAAVAAHLWAGLSPARRRAREDVLIAGIAAARGIPLATRNRQDFEPMAALGVGLVLADWS